MRGVSDKLQRKSIRLKEYDYAAIGYYFITICTHLRECLFGEIINEKMVLNRNGKIIHTEWLKTPVIRPNVRLDEFVIMPNHLHGILVIEYSMNRDNGCNGRGVMHYTPTEIQTEIPHLRSPSQTIGSIVRGFKSAVTKQINGIRNTPGYPIWQRNYYERIIRNDRELFNIRQYIISNPLKWEWDKENQQNWKTV